MKKRQLKKIVSRMSRKSPARFRYSEQVKAAWVRRRDRESPAPSGPRGRGYYFDLDAKGNPVPCGLWRWCYMFEFQDKWRVLQQTQLGTVMVSTVFLGTDHSWDGPRPILFESMIFGGPLDQEQERYATRAEALNGHVALIGRCRAILEAPGVEA